MIFGKKEAVKMNESQKIKAAAAFRFKYRAKSSDGQEQPRVNIAPHLVAWHQKNRRGMLPNANRCQQLLLSYCGDWDCDEADHQSVCVQIKPKCNVLVDYNKKFRENNPAFAKAESRPEVAAASHSHLNLTLHNVRDGAGVTFKSLSRFCRDGKLSLELVGHEDKDMAGHAQRGLLWEVLVWQMEDEEPHAFDIIQASFNSKNSTALVEHEMERLNGLVTVIMDSGVGLADQFNWRLVRDRLMESGNTVVAEAPEFLGLCQMVMRALGGACAGDGDQGYNHWQELKSWHEALVNPKTRRVRLATLAKLASVPPQYPRVRNALFRLAYSGQAATPEQIRNGQVFTKTIASLNHLEDDKMKPVLEKAEQVSISRTRTRCASPLPAPNTPPVCVFHCSFNSCATGARGRGAWAGACRGRDA